MGVCCSRRRNVRSKFYSKSKLAGLNELQALAKRRGVEVPKCDIPANLREELFILAQYEFPFKNLVFGGGGNRLFAYTGALQVLHEVGILEQCTRYAGTSLGALTACFAALGIPPRHIIVEVEKVRKDVQNMLLDARFGLLSLLPNLKKSFGWHPARAYREWLEVNLADYAGDRDITFREFYERTGKELCTVATNLNQMSAEYCHVKTTPEMPVILALRMSMSLPVLLGAVRYKLRDTEDVFVDGGLLCNYPIHVYDGWWLSMDPADNYFKRLRPVSEVRHLFETNNRFKPRNDETLGVCLYTADESSLMQLYFKQRYNGNMAKIPDTKLAKKRKKGLQAAIDENNVSLKLISTFSRFFDLLEGHDVDQSGTLDFKEFKNMIKDNKDKFTQADFETLFGEGSDVNTVFESLDEDGNGTVDTLELLRYAESKGLHLTARFLGYERQEIRSFKDYVVSLQNSVFNHAMREFVCEDDYDRTIGVDSHYIRGTDFSIETPDRDFLFEQGYRATIAYLSEYVRKNNPPKRPEFRDEVFESDTEDAPNDKRTSRLKSDLSVQINLGAIIIEEEESTQF
ncbi:uncharacterized protein LOC117101509 isoform X1 [Anneissia japonica]|uniref:uncharacterized protein LOC117101509 isoform X1 n=1 Tax=Anneissia japonica TaxID=1529436 RepID=UPI001425932E|nr:uncharacterized protein LOC117101509 isoform X1 [Anneissia japonica]